MRFMSNAQIETHMSNLRRKLERQQSTVKQTQAELDHWRDQLELPEKKEAPTKKAETSKSD